MKLPSVVKRALDWRRRHRVRFILSKVNTKPGMRILDIGCGIDGRSFDDHIPPDYRVCGVDVQDAIHIRHRNPNFRFMQADAQDLHEIGEASFDLCVSIGMLEHVTDERSFQRVATEIRRVAKQYVVVVPYRYAWLEPHYGMPFFPIWPERLQTAVVCALNLSGNRPLIAEDPDYIKHSTRWLSNDEYRRAFPDATIHLLPTLETIAIVRKGPI